MDRSDLLRRVPLFRDVPPADLARLASALQTRDYPPDTVIVEAGDAGHALFILEAGTVQVLYPAAGTDLEVARLTEGDVFGETAILNQLPRSATVRSLEPVKLLVLEREVFRAILGESPAMALGLLETLSTRIRGADEQSAGLGEKATRDPLTGLLNRRAFRERLAEEADRTRRYGGRFALILLDVDHLGSVNDTFGHEVGDEILAWIGRLLTEHTRGTDAPFRIGGEAFALLAPGTAGEMAGNVARRLVSLVAEARPPVEVDLRVTLSAGYASCPGDAARDSVLYALADRALLKAKAEGRNRACAPGSE